MEKRKHNRFERIGLAVALAMYLPAAAAESTMHKAAPPKPAMLSMPPPGWTFPVTKMETLTPSAAEVLTRPENVAGDFTLAKTPPVIDWGLLPGQWRGAYLWSNWGDSLFASDGNFYCSIGEHQSILGYAYVYQVNPVSKEMKMVVDVEKQLKLPKGDYAPGKIHGPLLEYDGCVYVMGYRGGGHVTGQDAEHHYQGDPMLRYHLATGKIEQMPIPAPGFSVPVAKIHKPTKMMYGLGNGGPNVNWACSFFVYDLERNKNVYVGGPQPNAARAILVAPDGRVYYNSGLENVEGHGKVIGPDWKGPRLAARPGVLARYDPKTGKPPVLTDVKVPGEGINAVLRAASECSSNGVAYCISWDGVVFTFDTKTEKMTVLGKTFEVGAPYTAVCKLSPDERFLYYVPGSHSGGPAAGCPIVQMDAATGKRKVLAFVFPYMMKQMNYHTGGTFGIDISPDGATLGICFNGRKKDQPPVSAQSLPHFDQCSVMLLHIPASER